MVWRNGRPFTAEEDQLLFDADSNGKTVGWMAKAMKERLGHSRNKGSITNRLRTLGLRDIGDHVMDWRAANERFSKKMQKAGYRPQKPVVREPDGRSVQYQPEPRSFGNSCLNDAG